MMTTVFHVIVVSTLLSLALVQTCDACQLDVFKLKASNNYVHASVLQYKYVSWLQKTRVGKNESFT